MTDEWDDKSAEAADEQIPPQHFDRAERFVGNAFERQRDECDDDERVENDGAEDCTLGRAEVHKVQRSHRGEGHHQHRGDDGEPTGSTRVAVS